MRKIWNRVNYREMDADQDFFNRCKSAGGYVITDYTSDASRICIDHDARVILQER